MCSLCDVFNAKTIVLEQPLHNTGVTKKNEEGRDLRTSSLIQKFTSKKVQNFTKLKKIDQKKVKI